MGNTKISESQREINNLTDKFMKEINFLNAQVNNLKVEMKKINDKYDTLGRESVRIGNLVCGIEGLMKSWRTK